MTSAPLSDLRVLDCSTLFAGPFAAQLLGDYGATVIKIEHPTRPDPSRGHGAAKDGHGLWWKILARNKQTMTLNLSSPQGRDVLLDLAAESDILIENFRPGTFEKWGLSYEELSKRNRGLVMVRVSGFGQTGPRRRDAGFGTLAEAMSGFAAITGHPDGPPTLPPLALADGVAGIMAAYAAMVALHARGSKGDGQVVDVSLLEPLMSLLGPQIAAYDATGALPQRTGNRSTNNAPRNLYRTSDGKWVAVSTSSLSIAERVMRLVGAGRFCEEEWFATGTGRAAHADELDAAVSAWISRHDAKSVLSAFREAEAAIALVYEVSDIVADEQLAALGSIVTVEDADIGAFRMLNVPFRLSSTPGQIQHAGRRHGEDTDSVLAGLGYPQAIIGSLRESSVIA